jgi:hypothetical protein
MAPKSIEILIKEITVTGMGVVVGWTARGLWDLEVLVVDFQAVEVGLVGELQSNLNVRYVDLFQRILYPSNPTSPTPTLIRPPTPLIPPLPPLIPDRVPVPPVLVPLWGLFLAQVLELVLVPDLVAL